MSSYACLLGFLAAIAALATLRRLPRATRRDFEPADWRDTNLHRRTERP